MSSYLDGPSLYHRQPLYSLIRGLGKPGTAAVGALEQNVCDFLAIDFSSHDLLTVAIKSCCIHG